MKTDGNSRLDGYVVVARALEKLFHPYVEVVIHDLSRSKVAFIANDFSKREKGDESILDDIDFTGIRSVIGPYEKINYDGKKLKSVSAVLRSEKNVPQYLFCINFDCSVLGQLAAAVEVFIGRPASDDAVKQLFKDDWQEKINIFIYESLKQRGLTLATASREEKRRLVGQLEKKGAFKAKNATTYAAHVLKISRASIYNYLNARGGADK